VKLIGVATPTRLGTMQQDDASFDTPFAVTTSELAMELLLPADARTVAALNAAPRVTSR
jgi:hypothetical protein